MLNTQQLSLPQKLMASSNGMAGVSAGTGSNRGGGLGLQDNSDGKASVTMTPQIGSGIGGASQR